MAFVVGMVSKYWGLWADGASSRLIKCICLIGNGLVYLLYFVLG